MSFNASFFIDSILFGFGLAMDAFSVSVANGLNEPRMKMRKILLISLVFAFFQALMPMLGWTCVHTIVSIFCTLKKFVPWIAFILLLYIGGSMIIESRRDENASSPAKVGFISLLIQGIATSIDALSVGFTTSEYNLAEALLSAFIIAAVTFVICFAGVFIGKKAGDRFSGRAGICGGAILIFIGLKIFIEGVF